MPSCVNIKCQEFKTLAKDTNVSETELELLVHKYQELNNTDTFPTKEWVDKEIQGPLSKYTTDQKALYDKLYSKPITFDSVDAAEEAFEEAKTCFPTGSVHLITNAEGKRELRVNPPKQETTKGETVQPETQAINSTEANEVQKNRPLSRFQAKMLEDNRFEITEDKSSITVTIKGTDKSISIEPVISPDGTQYTGAYKIKNINISDHDYKAQKILFDQVRLLLPPGSDLSLGSVKRLSDIRLLEAIAGNWVQVGTETITSGKDKFNVPVFQKPVTADMSKTEKFIEKQKIITAQMRNLLESNVLSITELKKISASTAFEISDLITAIENDRDVAIRKFNITDPVKIEALRQATTRQEIANIIGASNLIEYVKLLYTSIKTTSIPTLLKINALSKNWDAIMVMAKSTLSAIEDFNINNDSLLCNSITIDELSSEVSQNLTDVDEIREVERDVQEHWMIEVNTRSVLNDANSLIKHFFMGLPKIKITGYDENGNPITERVLNEFGAVERMSYSAVTASLLNWFFDAHVTNINDMLEVLKSKEKTDAWVRPIIDKLSDTSGKNSDFQSQFFSTMFKPFQAFDVVNTTNGKYNVAIINRNEAARNLINSIKAVYVLGELPLYEKGKVNRTTLNWLKGAAQFLQNRINDYNYNNVGANVKDIIGNIYEAVGVTIESDILDTLINEKDLKKILGGIDGLIKTLESSIDKNNINPFTYSKNGLSNKDYIASKLRVLLAPVATKMAETNMKSFYTNGKTYQSYITPSFLTILFNKLGNSNVAEVRDFILKEYAKYPWYMYRDGNPNRASSWRNTWLKELFLNPEALKVFAHKVNLSTNGKSYMKDMTSIDYIINAVAEYFSENDERNTRVPAWYRVTILSNKPSADYIRFYSERGENYKKILSNNFKLVFDQELSRITTVLLRNQAAAEAEAEGDPHAKDFLIKSFDTNGKEFQFLRFMNGYLAHSKSADPKLVNSRVGKLLNRKIKGEDIGSEAETELYNALVGIGDTPGIIEAAIDAEIQRTIDKYANQGILSTLAENIKDLNTANIRERMANFLWNDKYAQIMIQELTIVDPAYFKNSDDLQKRAAQLHSPGVRCNKAATDYNGQLVSDGVQRDVVLADFKGVVSSAINNVSEIFDRMIENAPESMKSQYQALKESIVNQFKDINVTDAQAYNSISSYRKKAIMFGQWSRQSEEVYNRLKNGTYTFSDLQTAFQPLKPFKYSLNEENMRVDEAPLNINKMPVQNKNAEYLLIMADALTRSEKTSKPNLLKVLSDIMEESANGRLDGIDTIQFNSAVKCGERGVIDLNKFITVSEGETVESTEIKAKSYLESLIYANKDTHAYNDIYVNSSDFENYCIQQYVPEHFKDHAQLIGSQLRYIIPSDLLDTQVVNGEEVKVTYKDRVTGKDLTRDEFKAEYERVNAENIELSTQQLLEDFKIGPEYSQEERNTAMSMALQEQMESSSRYGVDLYLACCIENGQFIIPEGDPIHSKIIEQLKNSIIKNRINKQKIAGGPVVQVSSFGTTKQLNIRFKSKKAGEDLLLTRSEFVEQYKSEHQDTTSKDIEKEAEKAYLEYVKENQAGIAYGEVYAPLTSDSIFENFVDEDGNIDIEAIEATNPELLQLIGCRTPTESKYSVMPLKIVGFMPREAGEAIMLPYDITLITGSDFDVDKEFLERKEIAIIKKSDKEIRKALIEKLAAHTKITDKTKLGTIVDGYLNNIANTGAKERIERSQDNLYRLLGKLYRQVAFTTQKPTSGRTFNNNKIFDMSYEVLTHETTAHELLTPGGFEEFKRSAYTVEAVRRGLITFKEAANLSNEQLKDLITENSDLTAFDTQVEYYKQNVAASATLGIFAIHKTAHVVLEGDNITVNFDNIGKRGLSPIHIGGYTIDSNTIFDNRVDQNGETISKILGAGVAASADAAKEPTMNYLNINMNTVGVFTTLVRFGIPHEVASLFMATSPITTMLNKNNIISQTKTEYLTKTIQKELEYLNKRYGNLSNSKAAIEELSLQDIQEAVATPYNQLNPVIAYKILNTYRKLSTLTSTLRELTFATRFNSITNAVGPLAVDNIMQEYRLSQFPNSVLLSDGKPFTLDDFHKKHPIIGNFTNTLNVARMLLGNTSVNSEAFRSMFNSIINSYRSLGETLIKDKKLLTKFSNFYQSYMLIAGENPVVDSSRLEYYIKEFPKEFLEIAAMDAFKDNLLIKAIKPTTDSKGRTCLSFNVTSLNKTEQETLSAAWADLTKDKKDKEVEKIGKKLAEDLFYYNFFRRGIPFSPETFMSLYPLALRMNNTKYINTFRQIPTMSVRALVDCFIRNNTSASKILPVRKITLGKNDGDFTLRETPKGRFIEVSSTIFAGQEYSKYQGLSYFIGEGPDKVKRLYRKMTDEEIVEKFKDIEEYKEDIERLEGEVSASDIVGNLNVGGRIEAFEEVSPLGNDGEYLEVSSDIINTPLIETDVSEESEPLFSEEADTMGSHEELPEIDDMEDTTLENRRERIFEIFEIAKNPQGELQRAKEAVKTPEGRDKFVKFLQDRLTAMGETVTKESIDKTVEDLNLC